MQIQLFCQLEHSLIGDRAKPALQALRMDTQNLQQVKDALLDNLRKEEQKLNTLYRFEGQTVSLFEEASQQLKIVRQSIEVLSQMPVDPSTGNYTFPKGMDSSWFTMKKSKAEQQRIALLNGQDGLNLPPEAEKYYNEIMTEALKNVSIEQWDESLKELNQLLLFDDEGNILRVMPVNMGSGNGLIILKNGVNDQQLTLQANQELSVEQRELLKESLPQLAAGLLSTLTGLGILGLDFAGTYFSGGTLAAVGVTQAAAVTCSTLTGAGALTVTDAISKMGVQSSTASYSFANNYGERQQSLYPNGKYVSSPEHTPNGKGGWGSEMDLGVDEAQKVLDKAKQVGKQKYGLKDGQIYEFQPDGSGGWHGYKIKGTELTDKKGGADVLRDWLKEGKINNSQYNKLRRGK